MIERTIDLHMGVGAPPPIVECTTGDTMWRWHIRIFLQETRWTIPSEGVAILSGKKADGNVFDILGTIDSNEILVDAEEQITAAVGPCVCVVRVFDTTGTNVATCPFVLKCNPSPTTVGPESETVLSAYNEVLSGFEDILAELLILPDNIPGMVSDWLAAHVDPETGYVIDNTLSIQGAAADAKAAGALAAPVFDQATAYTAGQHVLHNGQLYVFTADHAAGAWTGSDATAVNLGGEVSDLKSALDIPFKSVLNPISGLSWEQGSFNRLDGTVVSTSKAIRCIDFLTDDISVVSCDDVHKFAIWAWKKSDNSFVGHIQADGTYGTDSSYKFFQQYIVDKSLGYKYKISFYNLDNTDIYPASGSNCVTSKTIDLSEIERTIDNLYYLLSKSAYVQEPVNAKNYSDSGAVDINGGWIMNTENEDGYIQSTEEFSPSGPWKVEIKIKPTSLNTYNDIISTSVDGNPKTGFIIEGIKSGNYIVFRVYFRINGESSNVYITSPYNNINKWATLLFGYDGTNFYLTNIFENGKQYTETIGGGQLSSGFTIDVGRNINGKFVGLIDLSSVCVRSGNTVIWRAVK